MGGSSSSLNPGDQVIIGETNLGVVVRLQRIYGGWTSNMNECILLPSRVVSVNTKYVTVRAASGKNYQIDRNLLKKYEGEVVQNIPRFLDATRKIDENLLLVAIIEGNLSYARSLVKIVGANTAIDDVHPLFIASQEGHKEIVELLIQHGADIDATDADGNTALHISVNKNKFDVCKILVESGADINKQSNDKWTPIMIAASTGSGNILKYLASQTQANLNIGNSDNKTALHISVQNSAIASVETLLTYGADAKAVDCKKMSPFHMSVIKGNERIVKLFLEKRAANLVDSQTEDKLAAIHIAVLNDNQECLKLLIEYNADKNIRDKTMCTALHFAVIYNKFECIKLLVENGADINLKDEKGNTALHFAACVSSRQMLKDLSLIFGHVGGIQLLPDLDNGPDRSGRIITYLVEHGAFLYITNNDRQTPLELCLDPILRAVLISLESQRQQEEEIHKAKEIQQLRENINQMRDQGKCKMCKQRKANMVFQCGHKACSVCGPNLSRCYNCGVSIETRIELQN